MGKLWSIEGGWLRHLAKLNVKVQRVGQDTEWDSFSWHSPTNLNSLIARILILANYSGCKLASAIVSF